MNWLAFIGNLVNRIPLEKFIIPPRDQAKALQDFAAGVKPPESPKEPAPNPGETSTIIKRTPAKVSLKEHPVEVTQEQTVDYQNREIGKLLLRMERHYAQRLRINGVPCDCLVRGQLVYGPSLPVSIGHVQGSVLTHNGNIRRVTQRMNRRSPRELRQVKVAYTNIPLLVTREHPVLGIWDGWKANWRNKGGGLDESRLRWISAVELTDHSFVAFPRIKTTKDMGIISHDFAELLGWYVAEGFKEGNRIVLTLGKGEEENIERVGNLIERCLGKAPILRYRETAIHIEYTDGAFAKIFSEFGATAPKKRVPIWLIHLPEEKQVAFLRGYLFGDGHIESRDGYSITANTISTNLAYLLRLLLFRLGYLHSLFKLKQSDGLIGDRIIIGNGIRYQIDMAGEAAKSLGDSMGIEWPGPFSPSARKPRNLGWVTNDYILIPVKSNDPVSYSGKVYNIAVDEDESYVSVQAALHNCGSQKHLLDLESLCEETIPMVSNPHVYYRIVEWIKKVGPKSTDEAAKSGLHDEEYPIFSHEARDFRKEIIGTLDPNALFPQVPGEPEGTRILPVISEEEKNIIRERAQQKIDEVLGVEAKE
jgi:hypothetical protein